MVLLISFIIRAWSSNHIVLGLNHNSVNLKKELFIYININVFIYGTFVKWS